MRLQQSDNGTFTNFQANNGKDFSVTASGKMFHLIISGMYTYKMSAVVREIMTNAYDAHVEAGCPEKPFRVFAPSNVHPYFEVEDFGVGMSEQVVTHLYTSLGESTKDGSDSMAGAWGTGSKSPFAYTSQFTVRSRFDGIESIYLCYIQANGTPRLEPVSSVPTDSPNGVKVTVPVKDSDFRSFLGEIMFWSSFYDTQPEIKHLDMLESMYKKHAEISDISIYTKLGRFNSYHFPFQSAIPHNKIMCRMGPVVYPLDIRAVGIDHDHGLNDFVYNLSVDGLLVVNVPMGSVAINPNRESLDYTDETKEVILGALLGAKQYVDSEYEKLKGTSLSDIQQKIRDFQANGSILSKFFSDRTSNFIYQMCNSSKAGKIYTRRIAFDTDSRIQGTLPSFRLFVKDNRKSTLKSESFTFMEMVIAFINQENNPLPKSRVLVFRGDRRLTQPVYTELVDSIRKDGKEFLGFIKKKPNRRVLDYLTGIDGVPYEFMNYDEFDKKYQADNRPERKKAQRLDSSEVYVSVGIWCDLKTMRTREFSDQTFVISDSTHVCYMDGAVPTSSYFNALNLSDLASYGVEKLYIIRKIARNEKKLARLGVPSFEELEAVFGYTRQELFDVMMLSRMHSASDRMRTIRYLNMLLDAAGDTKPFGMDDDIIRVIRCTRDTYNRLASAYFGSEDTPPIDRFETLYSKDIKVPTGSKHNEIVSDMTWDVIQFLSDKLGDLFPTTKGSLSKYPLLARKSNAYDFDSSMRYALRDGDTEYLQEVFEYIIMKDRALLENQENENE